MLVPVLLALAALAPPASAPGEARTRVAVLVPVGAEPSWRDDAFLAAIPAAAALVHGPPVALAVDAAAPWRPELLRFLARYEPERVLWVGAPPSERPDAARDAIEVLPCASDAEAAALLAAAAWRRASRVVLYDTRERGAALAAAALAARLGEPLLPVREGRLEPAARAAVEALGATRALLVGAAEARASRACASRRSPTRRPSRGGWRVTACRSATSPP